MAFLNVLNYLCIRFSGTMRNFEAKGGRPLGGLDEMVLTVSSNVQTSSECE